MQKLNRGTRAQAFLPLFAAVAVLAACDDSPTEEEHDHAEEIASLRITIGSSTVELNADDNAVISGTIPVVIANATQSITVDFLDDGGASINSELEEEFELRVTPSNSVVTFAPTGTFSGTITRGTPGQSTLALSLFHLEENHSDIDRTITVVVP